MRKSRTAVNHLACHKEGGNIPPETVGQQATIQRHRSGLHASLNADTLKADEGSREAIVQLDVTETGLLEDCFEDWRGLWEVVWADPDKSVQNAVALVTSLVKGGYLTTLGVSDWDQARAAEPMTTAAALAVVEKAPGGMAASPLGVIDNK
jgi:hypothetical protein